MHGPDPEPHYSLSYRIKACFGLIGGMLGVIFLIDYFDEPYLRAMAVRHMSSMILAHTHTCMFYSCVFMLGSSQALY